MPPTGAAARLAKPRIGEAEMHLMDERAREAAPRLAALADQAALPALLSVYAPALTLREVAVKAQRNAGGGACFPLHVDSDPSVDRRVVTAILYLNRGWDAARDGGALRLAPFPRRAADGARYVDVDPLEGRLVLMSATEMHHRVLPAFATRYCVTLWLFGSVSKRAPAPPTLAPDCASLARVLAAPRYRKHVARVALSDDWEQSLREAHAAEDCDVAVASQRRDVEKIKSVLAAEIAAKFHRFTPEQVAHVLADPRRVRDTMDELGEDVVIQWFG